MPFGYCDLRGLLERHSDTVIRAEMERLSKALGTSPGVWYGMQASFDLRRAQKSFRRKVRPIAVAA